MAILSLLSLVVAAQSTPAITIDNIEPGTTVRYPVVALRGTAPSNDIALGADWPSAVRFPVLDGKWAGFVELKPGPNMIVMQSGRQTMRYKLTYEPSRSPYKVLTIFLHGKDEEPRYQANRLGDKYLVREKMDVAMKLMQSATAEAMNQEGLGRKTFNLEFENDGKVKVHFVELPMTGKELRDMESTASWGYIYGQLKERFPEATTKWNGVLGFTRYDHQTKVAGGHYALGGGALALFGTGTMQWWPDSLKEVPGVLFNVDQLDTSVIFDDSNRRQTVWANVSTAYGAMLHEMGHTFGLPHSADRFSVMSRGFDFFSRWFVPVEAVSRTSQQKVVFKDDERMRWDPFFAARLAASPFFQPDNGVIKPLGAPRIQLDGDVVRFEAPDGVKIWGAERDDLPHVWDQTKGEKLPTSVTMSVKELREKLGTDKEFRLVLIDGLGQQTTRDIRP